MTSEEAIQPRSRRPRHLFTRGDSTAMERFSAAFASAAASVSNTFSHSRSTPTKTATEHQEDSGSGSPTIPTTSTATTTITSPTTTTSTTLMSDEVQPINLQHQLQLNTASVTSSPTRYRSQVQTQISTSSEVEPPVSFANTPNTLRVPSSGYGGAIPRRSVISRDSSADSTASDAPASSAPSMASHKRTCFCGHYSEQHSGNGKRGRCKFCRSRAKYMPGQRSFDASRLFGRRREKGEPRRAVSEDQRGQSEEAGDLEGKVPENAKSSFFLCEAQCHKFPPKGSIFGKSKNLNCRYGKFHLFQGTLPLCGHLYM